MSKEERLNSSLNVRSSVAIIILNWNGWADTIECLDSLKSLSENYRIFLVDNGSTDISIRKIRDYCIGKFKVNEIIYEPSTKEYRPAISSENSIDMPKSNPNLPPLDFIVCSENVGYAEGNNLAIRYSSWIYG